MKTYTVNVKKFAKVAVADTLFDAAVIAGVYFVAGGVAAAVVGGFIVAVEVAVFAILKKHVRVVG